MANEPANYIAVGEKAIGYIVAVFLAVVG